MRSGRLKVGAAAIGMNCIRKDGMRSRPFTEPKEGKVAGEAPAAGFLSLIY